MNRDRYFELLNSKTLYKLVQEGKVPSQEVGRHWRFRKKAVDRWLDETPVAEPKLKGNA